MEKTPTEYNNAKLAYEYTKSTWTTVSASYDVVTAKLTTALGFSGVLLRFAADLSDKSWLLYVKMLICIALVMAIFSCWYGLIPRGTGEVEVDPDDFLDIEHRTEENPTRYYDTEEQSYLYIARGLNDALKGLKKNRKLRIRCLSTAIWLLSATSIGFAVSVMGKAMLLPNIK